MTAEYLLLYPTDNRQVALNLERISYVEFFSDNDGTLHAKVFYSTDKEQIAVSLDGDSAETLRSALANPRLQESE